MNIFYDYMKAAWPTKVAAAERNVKLGFVSEPRLEYELLSFSSFLPPFSESSS